MQSGIRLPTCFCPKPSQSALCKSEVPQNLLMQLFSNDSRCKVSDTFIYGITCSVDTIIHSMNESTAQLFGLILDLDDKMSAT